MAHWDPAQYARYREERGRPFGELLARIGAVAPAYVVDLGCGSGELTATLLDRWPDAAVTGVDSSGHMVAAARELELAGRLAFVEADAAGWQPGRPVDVVVSNALLQWVPGHLALIERIAGWLAPGGWFGFQVPDNFGEPSHTILRDLRMSSRWQDRLGAGADRSGGVERPETYLAGLLAAGLDADVWQTTYLHVLSGADPVLEWVKGTALRPVLSLLDDGEQRDFLAEYAVRLRAAYPAGEHGTVFPFRRTFAVARRSEGAP